jgi:hypothetical protein
MDEINLPVSSTALSAVSPAIIAREQYHKENLSSQIS